ncbi:MAG: WYL domain-containing protein [Spirochaetaceae bacterium]
MKKIERLLTIVLALKNYGKMTAKDLSNLIEVNIRTIYRDMDAISQMDIPLIASPGSAGGYEIMESYFIPSISLTKDEILALLISKKLIDTVEIPGFGSSITSSFLKIQNLVNNDDMKDHKKILERIDFNIIEQKPKKTDFFHLIKESFLLKKTLLINYYSPKKMISETREIIPYVLHFDDGCWYLISKCKNRDSERTFRLDRILNIELTDNDYVIPEDFDINKFNYVDSFKKDADSPDGVDIILKLTKPRYEIDKNKLLFQYRKVVEKDDHYLIYTKSTYPNDYLFYALKNYRNSEIISPDNLRDKLKEKLTERFNVTMEKYS